MVFQKPLHHHMPKGHQHDLATRYVPLQNAWGIEIQMRAL